MEELKRGYATRVKRELMILCKSRSINKERSISIFTVRDRDLSWYTECEVEIIR